MANGLGIRRVWSNFHDHAYRRYVSAWPGRPLIAHLQHLLFVVVGKGMFSKAIQTSGRRVANTILPPSEFLFLLQSNLTALGKKCRPSFVGFTMRCLPSCANVRE